MIGIYTIINIINGKRYIGASKDVYLRLRKHRQRLKNNSHTNKYLQSSWNKHGEDSFDMFLISICDLSKRQRG